MAASDILLMIRIGTIVVFAWSFGTKVLRRRYLERSIVDFGLTPQAWVRPIAIAVLAAEAAVVGLLVIGGPALATGLALAGILVVGFSIAIASSLVRRQRVRCSCFGPSNKPVSAYDLARNVFLVGCVVSGAVLATNNLAPPTAGGWPAVAVLSVLIVMIVINAETIVESLRRAL